MRAHALIFAQNQAEMAALREGAAAGLLDDFMGLRFADLAGEGERNRLGENQTVSDFEIFGHARRFDFKSFENGGKLRERAAGEQANFGQGLPFGVPAAQAALMFLDHRGKHGGDEGRHADGGRQSDCAADGILFVRHGGRTAAARRGRLERFADFGLGKERNITGDLAERADEQTEDGGDFGEAVAGGVPRYGGQRKIEIFRERGGYGGAARIESGQSADGAAKLKHERAAARGTKARGVAIESVKPAGSFEAESDGRGLLQPGASGEQGAGVGFGNFCNGGSEAREIAIEKIERIAKLEDRGGIERVLAGGAPMNETGGGRVMGGNQSGERVDERDGEVAGLRGFLGEKVERKKRGHALRFDGARGGFWRDGGANQSTGERGLKIEDGLQAAGIGKNFEHRGRSEQGIEQASG